MRQTKGLFWLSSYPKSGNTWFRVFLANVLHAANKTIALNDVDQLINDRIVTDRAFMDKVCGFNTALLNDNELDTLNPSIYKWVGMAQQEISYHKTHKAYTYVNVNEPLIPNQGCLGSIYFVRNPLDVAISLANHFSFSINEAIEMLGNKTYSLTHFPLRQTLLSWSMHVNSWVNAESINLLVLRYEDMHLDPLITFTKAAQFLQLDTTPEMINQAISLAQFDKLQQYEATIGFMDKPPKLKHFFRKGTVGDWQNTLTESQVQQIIHEHGDTMQAFGYVDANHQPIT
ncbi:MAG: sulfotransferase domain-containing protein [Legionellales bacterium]